MRYCQTAEVSTRFLVPLYTVKVVAQAFSNVQSSYPFLDITRVHNRLAELSEAVANARDQRQGTVYQLWAVLLSVPFWA
jgi:hypothetical protein